MIAVLLKHFMQLQMRSKIAYLIAFISVLFGMYMLASKAYYQRKYLIKANQELKEHTNKHKASEKKIDSLIELTFIVETKKAKKSSSNIDVKKTQDEKIIDNRVFTDNDIDLFLAGFED